MKLYHWLILIVIIIVVFYLTRKFMFKKVIGYIIQKNEGGYVNDPNDKGGETKYGISKKAYPKLDIKNLTLEQAEEIYYNDYFLKLPTITNINLMYQVLDMAINAGVKKALSMYKVGITVDEYRKERIKYYQSLPQFNLYGQGWTARALRNLV